ncbi:hypothetical protein [Duganella vulcania]|uniref:Uncharacterized protein n=1 Tax=Duganella vulcania TaxID=2692166 RepID=A0A845GUT4_9BURK|nr:hypothetical protein [Duganella vulcania]MYM97821.1 hypothetical protein [Duganella vulcania]
MAIDLEVAKQLAHASCASLSGDLLEAENCWIFFNERRGDFAVAVSISGQVSHVYDFRDNPEMMQDYLMMFSAYCSGDEARAGELYREFMRRYYADELSPRT